jgi:hypothetical protein
VESSTEHSCQDSTQSESTRCRDLSPSRSALEIEASRQPIPENSGRQLSPEHKEFANGTQQLPCRYSGQTDMSRYLKSARGRQPKGTTENFFPEVPQC